MYGKLGMLRIADALSRNHAAHPPTADLPDTVGDDADVAMTMTGPRTSSKKSSMKGTMVSKTQSPQQRTVVRQQAHEGLVRAAAR